MRGLVLELTHAYGVKEIFGFRYGFEGLVARFGHEPLRLTPGCGERRSTSRAGPMLGTSRGSQDPGEMVDTLEALGIGVLFVIGGDGTLRGATKIVAEIERRELPIAVVGIPKTIDNDIHFIDRSFGFESAFAAAVEAIRSAHVEATGARNGIGLVKLMGRHSGLHRLPRGAGLDRRELRADPRGAAAARRANAGSCAASSAGWPSGRTPSSSSPRGPAQELCARPAGARRGDRRQRQRRA